MIKESIQHTIKLIQDIQKVNPTAYHEEKYELDKLVKHMESVNSYLEQRVTG